MCVYELFLPVQCLSDLKHTRRPHPFSECICYTEKLTLKTRRNRIIRQTTLILSLSFSFISYTHTNTAGTLDCETSERYKLACKQTHIHSVSVDGLNSCSLSLSKVGAIKLLIIPILIMLQNTSYFIFYLNRIHSIST